MPLRLISPYAALRLAGDVSRRFRRLRDAAALFHYAAIIFVTSYAAARCRHAFFFFFFQRRHDAITLSSCLRLFMRAAADAAIDITLLSRRAP